MSQHAQREANSLRIQLERVEALSLPDSSITWPAIDYNQVSTTTCTNVLALLRADHVHAAPTAPDTPRRVRVAREIDCILAERIYLAKQRVCKAQQLEVLIKARLPAVIRFLEAARRSSDEQFFFPDAEEKVVENVHAIRHAMDTIVDMLRENADLDDTDATTDPGDVDTTLVDVKKQLGKV